MNFRNAINFKTYKELKKLFTHYSKKKQEVGYSSYYESLLCKNFVKFMGSKGYCDAVNSGTSALYIASACLKESNYDEAIICPTTNVGTLSSLIINKFKKIHLCDSEKNSYQINLKSLKKKINKRTKVIIITHVGGFTCDLSYLKIIKRNYPWVKIIEDCSQSFGTTFNKKKVGTFGDISCFSTMFRKNLVTGGIGGLIYTKNKNIYNKCLSLADRGKLLYKKNFNPKDYSFYKYPSLNFNLDEISCFIGNYNLTQNLKHINETRFIIYNKINSFLKDKNVNLFSVPDINKNDFVSLYFLPITINSEDIRVINKVKKILKNYKKFIFNFKYHECIYEWKNFHKFLSFKKNDHKNIMNYQNKTFNFLFNEKTKINTINHLNSKLLEINKRFT